MVPFRIFFSTVSFIAFEIGEKMETTQCFKLLFNEKGPAESFVEKN